MSKRRISTFLSVRIFNPLETTGRRSGMVRRTPVGPAVEGDVVWIVAEHGRHAGYVRNIEADPRVRIRLGRRWRSATARAVPDDDPRERMRGVNGLVVRAMGSELLTVRIDLDP
jgi:deazaflavin-dependent oxidoreductase (nitroreductase family)